jgi:hypothetical protein
MILYGSGAKGTLIGSIVAGSLKEKTTLSDVKPKQSTLL